MPSCGLELAALTVALTVLLNNKKEYDEVQSKALECAKTSVDQLVENYNGRRRRRGRTEVGPPERYTVDIENSTHKSLQRRCRKQKSYWTKQGDNERVTYYENLLNQSIQISGQNFNNGSLRRNKRTNSGLYGGKQLVSSTSITNHQPVMLVQTTTKPVPREIVDKLEAKLQKKNILIKQLESKLRVYKNVIKKEKKKQQFLPNKTDLLSNLDKEKDVEEELLLQKNKLQDEITFNENIISSAVFEIVTKEKQIELLNQNRQFLYEKQWIKQGSFYINKSTVVREIPVDPLANVFTPKVSSTYRIKKLKFRPLGINNIYERDRNDYIYISKDYKFFSCSVNPDYPSLSNLEWQEIESEGVYVGKPVTFSYLPSLDFDHLKLEKSLFYFFNSSLIERIDSLDAKINELMFNVNAPRISFGAGPEKETQGSSTSTFSPTLGENSKKNKKKQSPEPSPPPSPKLDPTKNSDQPARFEDLDQDSSYSEQILFLKSLDYFLESFPTGLQCCSRNPLICDNFSHNRAYEIFKRIRFCERKIKEEEKRLYWEELASKKEKIKDKLRPYFEVYYRLKGKMKQKFVEKITEEHWTFEGVTVNKERIFYKNWFKQFKPINTLVHDLYYLDKNENMVSQNVQRIPRMTRNELVQYFDDNNDSVAFETVSAGIQEIELEGFSLESLGFSFP